jgi:hypothetical protein
MSRQILDNNKYIDEYSPTFVDWVNVDSEPSSQYGFSYVNHGNGWVDVVGAFTIDPTLADTTTEAYFNLPIPSELGSTKDLSGFIHHESKNISGIVRPDTTNNRARIVFNSMDAISNPLYIIKFSYRIK